MDDIIRNFYWGSMNLGATFLISDLQHFISDIGQFTCPICPYITPTNNSFLKVNNNVECETI